MKTIYEDVFETILKSGEKCKEIEKLKNMPNITLNYSMLARSTVIPFEDYFYVLTRTLRSSNNESILIEKTNSLKLLNIIVERTTYHDRSIDDDQMNKIREFLTENNCKFME